MGKFKLTKKDFDMLSQEKSESESEESESEEKKKLKEDISKIDSEYKNSPVRTYGDIEVPNTAEKTYKMPTHEETVDKASSEISPLYDAKINSLNSESSFAEQKLEDEKDELYKRAEQSLKELKGVYDGAKESTSNEALKRGLARSSIILNQLKDLEGERIEAAGGILTQRDKDLSSIAREIDELQLKLVNDVNELNEEKAKEINQRIEELYEKYQAEASKVDEYNNKLRQEKAETMAKLKEAGLTADETQSKEYVTMVANKTRAFYSYYYSLGENALSELQKDRQYVIDNIGQNGYDYLLRYFK